jgi:predicted DCC family thiol-disulfide oxidoreductase YuxK
MRPDPRFLQDYPPDAPPLVLFDGDCGFCQWNVQRLLAWDHKQQLHFAPQQADYVQHGLTYWDIPADLGSIIVVDQQKAYFRSGAVLMLGIRLGGLFRILAFLGFVIPRPLRDFLYDLIAKNRHRIMSTQEACLRPTQDQLARVHDLRQPPSWWPSFSQPLQNPTAFHPLTPPTAGAPRS